MLPGKLDFNSKSLRLSALGVDDCVLVCAVLHNVHVLP